MDLVETTEMSKISVSDLAAKALVNRSTFYLHYNDVTSVAADIEQEIAKKISLFIDDFNIADIYGSTLTLFRKLTKRLEENARMKQYIFFSTHSDYVIARLKQIFVEKTKSSILNRFPELDEKEVLYPLTYAASGIIDCYIKWGREANADTSLDSLILTVSALTEHIISNITKYQK